MNRAITLDWADRDGLFEEVTFNLKPHPPKKEICMWNSQGRVSGNLIPSDKNSESWAPFENCKSHP